MPLSVLATSEIKSTPSEKPFISLGIGSHPVKSIIKVSGYVADENGKAIENAEVQILDSTIKVFTNKKGYFSLKCASGSKLFVKKGILQSETITLGSSDENVTIPLFTIEVQNNLILGRIAPKEIQEEVIVVTSGDFVVEDSEKENVEKPQDTTNVLIKGTVTDESNLPLPGVNIIIKDTTHGTQTDFDGNYSIEAEPNQTLVFSYVGYETKEIILSNINNEINISMEPDMDVLGGQIVVIAGGISYSEEGITNPYQPYNYYDDEQRANREERRTYAKKVKAFQKVKAERKKEARQLKKNNRKK
ncbi:MAG: carboxypeptidase-like regulatory domain-containing protein [Flavobacteriaceae bacterium]|nr:carboxypeptidase-like regulatory domain-containing protein [Flavobacteriaceae bacterium]